MIGCMFRILIEWLHKYNHNMHSDILTNVNVKCWQIQKWLNSNLDVDFALSLHGKSAKLCYDLITDFITKFYWI